jgi:hypothetical protein
MNISIDENVLENTKFLGHTLTVGEFLLCMMIKLGDNPNKLIPSLIDRRILVQDMFDNTKLYLRSECSTELQRVLLESEKNVPRISDIEELTIKLQELFPKERKPPMNGSGAGYSYRGNKRDVTVRLQKFMKLYGYTSEHYDLIYKCTKRYVESFKYDKTYMKILPYFIMKDSESTLATELENMDDTIDSNNDLGVGDELL